MSNIWRLFKSDVKRLGSNVVTIIIVLGLVALPSIFSWYNILACWNVFDNTGNLTVAVANSDEGYQSDLVPLRINVGDQVISALRENDQLNWVFTDEEDAIDGARSGRYYAAVVIPQSFSADMMSFYSSDMQHASITYYTNQKKGAIAPKITDQGADQVSAKVNEVFAETISEIALGLSGAIMQYADDADVNGQLGSLATHMGQLAGQLDDAAAMLQSYSAVLESAQGLVNGSVQLLDQADSAAAGILQPVQNISSTAQEISSSLEQAKAHLDTALAQSAEQADGMSQAVDTAFANSAMAASHAEQLLRDQAAIELSLGNTARAQALEAGADEIQATNASVQDSHADVAQTVAQARQELDAVQASYEDQLKPSIEQLYNTAQNSGITVSSVAETVRAVKADLSGAADSTAQQLAEARLKLDDAASQLNQASTKLGALGQGVSQALDDESVEALRTIIGSDPQALASAIAAPVKMERVAVYPVENFGSAMSPLYTTLALWIGALLIMVTLRTNPSQRTLAELDNPTPRQVFGGRFLTIALISLLQSTVLSVGNLVFLGVQAAHPLLYVLCFWVSGLVFVFIIYTMVSLFANLGKALGVILLIVQVGGGGGSFPLQLLPEFFQITSPYLPVTHAVNAMRAAMFGIYQGDFWIELGTLLLFVIPVALMGLVLQKPLSLIVPRFLERVEKSKLM